MNGWFYGKYVGKYTSPMHGIWEFIASVIFLREKKGDYSTGFLLGARHSNF